MSSGLFTKFLLLSISLHVIAAGVIGFSKSSVEKITSYPILINYIEKKDHNVFDSKIVKRSIIKEEIKRSDNKTEKKVVNTIEPVAIDNSQLPKVALNKNKTEGQVKNLEEKNNLLGSTKVLASDLAYPDYKINPKPKYPLIAQRRGIEGELYLKVYVLHDGKVGELKVDKTSGYSFFDKSAVKAVKDWVFIPGKQNGEAVPSWVTVPIKFQLSKL